MTDSSGSPNPSDSHRSNGYNSNGSSANHDLDGELVRRLQRYRDALAEAAKQHMPITPEDEERLQQLQHDLNLPDDMVNSIRAEVIEAERVRADLYDENLRMYETAYREAANRDGIPLSDAIRARMENLEDTLHLNPQDAHIIRENIHSEWRSHLSSHASTDQTEDASQKSPDSNNNSNGNSDGYNAPSLPTTDIEGSPGDHQTQDSTDAPSDDDSSNGAGRYGYDPENDYRTLQLLIQNRQWREADEKTFEILLDLARTGSQTVDWLDAPAIADLSCTDLQTIDHLWRHGSNDKFGFRVQCDIYFSLSNAHPLVSDYSTTFGNQVGWILWEQEFLGFKYYDQLTFDHHAAPDGHLPAKWFWKISWWESIRCGGLGTGRGGCGDDGGVLFTFMKKLVNCNLKSPPAWNS